MKHNKSGRRFKVSTNGKGIVSHAGTSLLRELARQTGLVRGFSAPLLDTYRGPLLHQPGQVLVDLAVSIADGGDALAHLRPCATRSGCSGWSPPTRPAGGWWRR